MVSREKKKADSYLNRRAGSQQTESRARHRARHRVSFFFFFLRSWCQLNCVSIKIDHTDQVPARAAILQEQPLIRGVSRDSSKPSHQKPWGSLCAAREGLHRRTWTIIEKKLCCFSSYSQSKSPAPGSHSVADVEFLLCQCHQYFSIGLRKSCAGHHSNRHSATWRGFQAFSSTRS